MVLRSMLVIWQRKGVKKLGPQLASVIVAAFGAVLTIVTTCMTCCNNPGAHKMSLVLKDGLAQDLQGGAGPWTQLSPTKLVDQWGPWR